MNERGEVSLLTVAVLSLMTGLLLLCALELRKSFRLMERRTELFLCTKEFKGELTRHLTHMGRANWGLKNLLKIQVIAIFIPGLQEVALVAPEIRKFLKAWQTLQLTMFRAKLLSLKKRGCPLDPRAFLTPYKNNGLTHQRDFDDTAIPRSQKWSYHVVQVPWMLTLEVGIHNVEAIMPRIRFQVTERAAKLSSMSSWAW